jgi:hypothetical protein
MVIPRQRAVFGARPPAHEHTTGQMRMVGVDDLADDHGAARGSRVGASGLSRRDAVQQRF